MRTILLTAFCTLAILCAFAQSPHATLTPLNKTVVAGLPAGGRILAEDCSNGKDDDGNGFIDCEDFTCYFQKVANSCNCIPSNTLWTVNGVGELFWADTKTGVERKIGAMGYAFTDIAWTPDGKLFGVDFNANLYEIDPATAQITFRYKAPGFANVNAMTTDQNGNFIMAGGSVVFSYNPVTGGVKQIADLTSQGAMSGGDLAFSNGVLYLSCLNNLIARINTATGGAEVFTIKGLSAGASIFGIVSAADGSLYISGTTNIFKLNPATMEAAPYYNYKSTTVTIWGLANYNDKCNAPEPVCKASVSIEVQSPAPFCTSTGVDLQATGKGITGNAAYQWKLPNGTLLPAPAIKAVEKGWYFVTYASADGTCKEKDSIYLDMLPTPIADLGKDTVLCLGEGLTIENKITNASFAYLWQNGTTSNTLAINQKGTYWLSIQNACGSAKDTIIINEKLLPAVSLGVDRDLCRYDTLHLWNQGHQAGWQYLWNTNAATNSIIADKPGTYWAAVTNVCGTVKDTIIVTEKKDNCECYLYTPNAFTPNKDGLNDVFKVNATCGITGEMMIYNRWGNVVFTTKDLSKGWNGYYNSQLQPGDTYVYVVKYTFLTRPKALIQKGTLTLVR